MFADEDEARLFARSIGCEWVGRRLRYFESVDSTNSRARRLAELGWPAGTVVLAEHQTRGRGRLGRRWLCPAGAGILVSVVVPRAQASAGPGALPWVTAAGALAMAEAVETTCRTRLLVDWPNDLVLPDPLAGGGFRKLGGVLVETRHGSDMAVLGVGLNVDVRREEFPPALRDSAGSVAEYAARRPDRRAILGAFLPALEARLSREAALAAELAERSATVGRDVIVGERKGRAVGFDGAMRLVVEFPGGRTETLTTRAMGETA